MLEQDITIINKLGLHARAAAKLVGIASAYDAQIFVSKNGQEINGKSIMGVMMLAASCNTIIHLRTDGPDEKAAMNALVELINDRFGEGE